MLATHSVQLIRTSSQYASGIDSVPLSITGNITVEVYMKLSSLPSSAGVFYAMISKWDTNSARSYLFYIDNVDNQIKFLYSQTGTLGTITQGGTDASATSGIWIHYACSCIPSSQSLNFYKDGQVVAAHSINTGATSIHDNSSSPAIGASFATGVGEKFFDGFICYARIWNYARTGQEIFDNYNRIVGREDGLVGHWYFNKTSQDFSKNDNDFTLNGNPSYTTDIPFAFLSPTYSNSNIPISLS